MVSVPPFITLRRKSEFENLSSSNSKLYFSSCGNLKVSEEYYSSQTEEKWKRIKLNFARRSMRQRRLCVSAEMPISKRSGSRECRVLLPPRHGFKPQLKRKVFRAGVRLFP